MQVEAVLARGNAGNVNFEFQAAARLVRDFDRPDFVADAARGDLMNVDRYFRRRHRRRGKLYGSAEKRCSRNKMLHFIFRPFRPIDMCKRMGRGRGSGRKGALARSLA